MGLHLRAGLGPISYGKTLRLPRAGSASASGGWLVSVIAAALLTLILVTVVAGAVGALFGLVYVLTSPISRTRSDGLHIVGYLVTRVLAVFMLTCGLGIPVGVAAGLLITENYEYALWLILAGVFGGIAVSWAGVMLWRIASLLKREEGLSRTGIWPWGVSAFTTSVAPVVITLRWSEASTSDWAWLPSWLVIASAMGFVAIHGLFNAQDDQAARGKRRSLRDWTLWIMSPAVSVGASLALSGW